MTAMVTEEKHGDEKGEEEDSDNSEFEEQALLVMFDEFVIKSGNDRRDAVDFEEVVFIVENGIDKVLIAAEISEREVFIALFFIHFRKVSVGTSKEERAMNAFEDFFAAFEADDSAIVLVEGKVSKSKVRFHACFDDVGIGELIDVGAFQIQIVECIGVVVFAQFEVSQIGEMSATILLDVVDTFNSFIFLIIGTGLFDAVVTSEHNNHVGEDFGTNFRTVGRAESEGKVVETGCVGEFAIGLGDAPHVVEAEIEAAT